MLLILMIIIGVLSWKHKDFMDENGADLIVLLVPCFIIDVAILCIAEEFIKTLK